MTTNNTHTGGSTKMTPEQFLELAMTKLRKPEDLQRGWKGLHSVYSGFNGAFKAYFPGSDPVEFQRKLVAEGKIVTVPTQGGVRIYMKKEAPANAKADGNAAIALAKILG